MDMDMDMDMDIQIHTPTTVKVIKKILKTLNPRTSRTSI